jgi:hypothetical protein
LERVVLAQTLKPVVFSIGCGPTESRALIQSFTAWNPQNLLISQIWTYSWRVHWQVPCGVTGTAAFADSGNAMLG